jgi:hypothetical protein
MGMMAYAPIKVGTSNDDMTIHFFLTVSSDYVRGISVPGGEIGNAYFIIEMLYRVYLSTKIATI